VLRNKVWHIRVYVPKALQPAIGKREITRSLGTGCRREAKHRAPAKYCEIEREICAILAGETTPISFQQPAYPALPHIPSQGGQQMVATISLQQLIDEYNASKAQGWAPKSKPGFLAKQREFLSYFGPGRDIKTIEDIECVKLRDGLYVLPRSVRSMARWRNSPLKEIIQHYTEAPAERHLSVSTVNSYMSHLSSLLGWAFEKKCWLHRNPMISVEMLKETDMSEHRRPPTDDELRTIFGSTYLTSDKNAENNF